VKDRGGVPSSILGMTYEVIVTKDTKTIAALAASLRNWRPAP
jgi:hypothetical protein